MFYDRYSYTEVSDLLHAYGAEVSLKNSYGETPTDMRSRNRRLQRGKSERSLDLLSSQHSVDFAPGRIRPPGRQLLKSRSMLSITGGMNTFSPFANSSAVLEESPRDQRLIVSASTSALTTSALTRSPSQPAPQGQDKPASKGLFGNLKISLDKHHQQSVRSEELDEEGQPLPLASLQVPRLDAALSHHHVNDTAGRSPVNYLRKRKLKDKR